jgi:hypothetical protein
MKVTLRISIFLKKSVFLWFLDPKKFKSAFRWVVGVAEIGSRIFLLLIFSMFLDYYSRGCW